MSRQDAQAFERIARTLSAEVALRAPGDFATIEETVARLRLALGSDPDFAMVRVMGRDLRVALAWIEGNVDYTDPGVMPQRGENPG